VGNGQIRRWLGGLVGVVCAISLLTGCTFPQVSAEDRLFLDLSVDFLGEVILPAEDFEGTPVGGLSALTYDRSADRFYVLPTIGADGPRPGSTP